ncbi:uncharacterized protein LOC126971691 [Leptidea sinapis]|uniref:uncharacterized protein LOC126971691 n=1 Tax=Leptidea sinapis TaxID=189913 RepID=UPI00212AB344|nr:uncharacterized protein LOC126971691 [Leptidea sinapis]
MRFLLIVILSLSCVSVIGQTLTNVRLADHTSYIIELLQRTVDIAQKYNWSKLKLDDIVMNIDEEVMNKTVRGTVEFTNGFVVSMQSMDLIQSTVQQAWLYDRNTNITRLELRSTLRMQDVAIGYDVIAKMDHDEFHNTGVIVHPLIHFPITLIRDLFTDELSSTGSTTLFTHRNGVKFVPENTVTQIISVLFQWNSTFSSFNRWATEIFAPTVLELAKTEHKIPIFCYDCPIV